MAHETDDLFDFGFTTISEDEQYSDESTDALRSALDKLYASILPLLDNLEKNPEKDYIYWPNRTNKISDFRKLITDIYTTTQTHYDNR